MRLETFFEKFELFAEAPGAVAKMRELVLNLAATGQLIPEVLERPVADDTQQMGGLVELVMGQAPAGDEYNSAGRGTVFVKVGEFGPLYPEQVVWTTKPLKFAKRGDVLVCVVGATVGKLNLAIDCAIGRSVAAIRPSPAIETKFLYYALIPYTLRLRRNSRGSAQGVIGKSELNAVSLWVPSVRVQRRIVAKVDELMVLCDRLDTQEQERRTRHAGVARASLSRFAEAPSTANLDFLFHGAYAIDCADLRKSILTLAVQGKLVPQALIDEPVEKTIEEARRAAGLAVRALRSVDPLEALLDVPESWRWVTVADVAETRLGKMLDKEKNRGESHPYLRNTNVHWFRFELESIKTMLFEPSELDEYRVEPGDVLICEGGHGIARSAVWKGDIPGVMFQKALHRVRPLNCLDGHFLAFCLWVYDRNEVLHRFYTGAGIPHFTGRALARVPFPLPPIAEQRRIVAKVDQLMALIDQLEGQLAESHTAAARLLEAVVAELAPAD